MRGGMGPGCTAKGITAPGAAGEQPQFVLALGVLLQPLRTMPIKPRVASGTSNRRMGLHPFLEQGVRIILVWVTGPPSPSSGISWWRPRATVAGCVAIFDCGTG